jgi:hypothetical protein
MLENRENVMEIEKTHKEEIGSLCSSPSVFVGTSER